MSAVTRVLRTPELIDLILRYLRDNDLARYARVSQWWFECVAPLAWRDPRPRAIPPLVSGYEKGDAIHRQRLDGVRTAIRKITMVWSQYDVWLRTASLATPFCPNVMKLRIHPRVRGLFDHEEGTGPVDVSDLVSIAIGALSAPTLKRLSLSLGAGETCRDAPLLTLLWAVMRGPVQLEAVTLLDEGLNFVFPAFYVALHDMFQAQRSLQKVVLVARALNDAVLEVLSSLPELTTVRLYTGDATRTTVQELLDLTPRDFPALRHLKVLLDFRETFSVLAAVRAALSDVEIVHDEEVSPPPALASSIREHSCSGLRTVFWQTNSLEQLWWVLEALSSSSRLEKADIGTDFPPEQLRDAMIEMMAINWPNLKHLCLTAPSVTHASCGITLRSLLSLSTHCRALASLEIPLARSGINLADETKAGKSAGTSHRLRFITPSSRLTDGPDAEAVGKYLSTLWPGITIVLNEWIDKDDEDLLRFWAAVTESAELWMAI